MNIAIGSDKSGFTLKEAVKQHLAGKGHTLSDLGLTDPAGFKAYYEVAPNVARAIQKGEAQRGILICGTGMGMAIVANKFKGIYAAVVEGAYAARMCAVINKANILTMGGWVLAPQHAIDLVERWLSAGFTEGFPPDRQQFLCNAFEQVCKIEQENFR